MGFGRHCNHCPDCGAAFRASALLAIVGLHFALMAPAFGWPIVLLAALATVNALWGAWLPTYSLTVLWALDGVLKLSAGVVMLFSNLIPAWPRF
jgi:hypothetical protein